MYHAQNYYLYSHIRRVSIQSVANLPVKACFSWTGKQFKGYDEHFTFLKYLLTHTENIFFKFTLLIVDYIQDSVFAIMYFPN